MPEEGLRVSQLLPYEEVYLARCQVVYLARCLHREEVYLARLCETYQVGLGSSLYQPT